MLELDLQPELTELFDRIIRYRIRATRRYVDVVKELARQLAISSGRQALRVTEVLVMIMSS